MRKNKKRRDDMERDTFGKKLPAILKIRSHLKSLTKTEAVAAMYVLENVKDIIYMSVTEVAEKAGVGETTVLRFCRKLGYKGFQDFKLMLAQDLALMEKQLDKNISEKDDADGLVNKVIASHRLILEETGKIINRDELTKAIEKLTHAKSILFLGVGSSGLTAIQAAHSFSRIGKKSDAKQDSHFQAIAASLLSEQDVVVGLSVSGSTKDTIDNLRIAKQTGACIICITQNAKSPITQIADILLYIAARENPLEGSSFSSQMSQMAVIEMLHAGVSLKLKETADKYRERTAQAVSEKLY